MALDNVISVEFTAEELQKINEAIASIEAISIEPSSAEPTEKEPAE